MPTTAEQTRLEEDAARTQNWKRWGPYLSERQWGGVREDYSADGDAWNYFPHDHARLRAYRWGEDGLLGFTDRGCRLCFALALWNGKDPILKERIFGLSNPQGNHGEDPKEAWYYLDSSPTHSYLKGLYKYPQDEYPYAKLINHGRGKLDRELELHDLGVFDKQEYFDVFAEYAKVAPEDILIRIELCNRGPNAADVTVLPTLWFRNSWSWGKVHESTKVKPDLRKVDEQTVHATHETLGEYTFTWETPAPVLFTENETNHHALYGSPVGDTPTKDAFHRYVIHGEKEAVALDHGTKCAPHHQVTVPANGSVVLRMRLRLATLTGPAFGPEFEQTFAARRQETDDFYASKINQNLSKDQQHVVRQAYAGLLWTRQFYQYIVEDWLKGDPNQPPPPEGHSHQRNFDWQHFYANDVLSMPDKWEYPWFAAWDLAFHMIPMARIDGDFAKSQLELLLREWYMHPNGQIPAYEWNFRDVNPPVHAWACWRVYKISAVDGGKRDLLFLERCFQKLLLNFTWWVNRKDVQGRHVFAGGFLGLDNIGLFDRSKPLPSGQSLAQADGTAWMAFYCATMMTMALELTQRSSAFEDIASKFFEHFVQIIDAMNEVGGDGLWDEQDGFYYDQLLIEGQDTVPLRVRSLVGLIPLMAVEVLDQQLIEKNPGFRKRMRWFLANKPYLAQYVVRVQEGGNTQRRLVAIASKDRLARVLKYVFDENEFLSPYGIRSLSKHYDATPYSLQLDGCEYTLAYEPAESKTGLFGGNSNWRGPIWFPLNYLLVESLERYDRLRQIL
jgi:hypothetical protein